MTDTEHNAETQETPGLGSELVAREDNIARMKVELSGEDVAEIYKQLYKEAAKDMNVKGFRKGKVPRNVIRQRIGADYIDDAAADALKDLAIRRGLRSLELTARHGDPSWHAEPDKVAEENTEGYAYEVSLPVLPEVDMPDYREFEITVPRLDITEGMRERYKERLAERYTEFPDKEGQAGEGDAFNLELSSTYADSGEAAPFKQEQLIYIIGREGNLPGWDEKLLGEKAGADIEFAYTMPEDFQDPRVGGRELNIKLELKGLHNVEEPEVDAEFVKEKLNIDSMEEFAKFLDATLEHERDQQFEQMKRELSMQQLIDKIEVKLSEDMISQEIDGLVQENDGTMRQHGSNLDEYLQQKGQELKEYRESLREPAERKIKLFLAMHEISLKEGISAENEDYQRYAMMLIQREGVPAEKVQELFKNERFFNEATYQVIKEKVLNHLADSVKVNADKQTVEAEGTDETSAGNSDTAEAAESE